MHRVGVRLWLFGALLWLTACGASASRPVEPGVALPSTLPTGCRRPDATTVACKGSHLKLTPAESLERAQRTAQTEWAPGVDARSVVRPTRCRLTGRAAPVPCWFKTYCVELTVQSTPTPERFSHLNVVSAPFTQDAQAMMLTCSWWKAAGPAPGMACRGVLTPVEPLATLPCSQPAPAPHPAWFDGADP